MTSAEVVRIVDKALELVELEADLRVAGRAAELPPGADTETAARLFRRASGLRRIRLALLTRCGIL